MTRAAFLGPAGTFSEEALLASASRVVGDGVEPVPLATVHEVVLAVQEERVSHAIAPIESASEGSVDATLDALANDAPEVSMIAEVVLPVRHALLAAPSVELDAVRVVVSHPQALAQCARYLRASLPEARGVAWTSTAEAVRVAVERAGEGWAAIGTHRAAALYGAAVLRDGIEDITENATRFVWLARTADAPSPGAAAPAATTSSRGAGRPAATTSSAGPHKTSLLFAGEGTGQSGWLVRCLSEFAFRGVNLTRIESRPRRDRLGDYLFFVDLDGSVDDERVRDAIDGLRAHCDVLRVLGSYPAA